MHAQRFDDIARRLTAAVSRRQTLALIAAGLPPLAPGLADAGSSGKRARRRCQRQQAVAVPGECACAWIGNGNFSEFACQSDPGCLCALTTEGTGYCTRPPLPSTGGCHRSADCPLGAACILTSNGAPVCTGPCHPPA